MAVLKIAGRVALALVACAVTLQAASAPPPAPQDREEVPEYAVKAAFLYNFAKYVEWPEKSFADEKAPIRIGVAGPDPFGDKLEKTFKDKTVGGRSFTFERFKEAQDIRPVHLLFVVRADKERTLAALAKGGKPGVLTVGEDPQFTRQGGTVSILIEEGKPRIEVNPDAAEEQKVTISSKLLKIATIVHTEK